MQQTQESKFGDFEEIKKEEPKSQDSQQQEEQVPARVRVPRNKELIGVIVQRLGGNRMNVKTTDGKTRNCRVPGRYRRRLWLRPKDIIMLLLTYISRVLKSEYKEKGEFEDIEKWKKIHNRKHN